jgi:hypothetical protein
MRTWSLSGAFDAGHIRGWTPDRRRQLDFHQLEITGHGEQLESDYELMRSEFGLRSFRDGAWLTRTFPGKKEYDWRYLDRLAAVSKGQVYLSICHYEWPLWLDERDLWSGEIVRHMSDFAFRLGERYRGTFAGYIPVVECGYWTAMMTDWARWWPAQGPTRSGRAWWQMYSVVGRMAIGISRSLKSADPSARIALSEPWAWHPHVSLSDQGRPFDTLLGRPDAVAAAETGTDDWGGSADLLQVVGLNFYNNWGAEQGWPLSRLLSEARRRYPDQAIAIGETGNCHFSDCHSVEGWLELIGTEVETANAEGARVQAITWAPILTLGDFDWGRPAPGAWVTWDQSDPKRKRQWDPHLGAIIRRYTDAG